MQHFLFYIVIIIITSYLFYVILCMTDLAIEAYNVGVRQQGAATKFDKVVHKGVKIRSAVQQHVLPPVGKIE